MSTQAGATAFKISLKHETGQPVKPAHKNLSAGRQPRFLGASLPDTVRLVDFFGITEARFGLPSLGA